MILTLGGLLLVVLRGLRSARLLGLITLSFLVGAIDLKLVNLFQHPAPQTLFLGMLIQDRLSRFFELTILVAMGLVTFSILGYARPEVKDRRELYALLLLTTVGLLLLPQAQHLALIYLSLELVSILSYLMVGIAKRDSLAIEGALKYFLFGSLATGTLLYGISLIYGLTGTMELPLLVTALPAAIGSSPLLVTVALIFLIVGFGFKVALVPFHMWAPDAYEGAPTPVAAFLSVGPKIAGFAVMARVFLLGITPAIDPWPWVLSLLAIFTMTIGNVVALVQTNVKRLLAYSSIAQAGYMVIGLAVATPIGLTATCYYLLAYLLMNVAAFAGVIAIGNTTGREDLGAFSGLAQREPFLAFAVAVAFLSLAGIPPMAGFFAKLWIFAAALKANAVPLAIAAAVNSVIALFYYVKVIKTMYLDPVPAAAPAIPRSRWLGLTLALCTVGLFVIGLWPGPWLRLIAAALPLSLRTPDLPWL